MVIPWRRRALPALGAPAVSLPDVVADVVADATSVVADTAQAMDAQLVDLAAALAASVAAFEDTLWELTQAARPRLRGWLHAASAVAAPAAAGWLVAGARPGRMRAAAATYSVGMCAMFSASAVYHRLPRTRQVASVLRRVDHSMIYAMIAGSWTPVLAATLSPGQAAAVAAAVWGTAAAAVATKLSDSDLGGSWFYGVLGGAGAVTLWPLLRTADGATSALFAAGGLVYAVGGVAFAARWPEPWPGVAGYHECFHAAVVAGAVLQFAAIARLVRSTTPCPP